MFDDDRSEFITLQNLRRVARELGETMDDSELQEMIERADSSGEGKVSLEDFYNIMTKKTFAWLIIHIYTTLFIAFKNCKLIKLE